MKIQIIQNEALIGNCNIDGIDEAYTLTLKTVYQEYFKTGKAKGKPKDISKQFFFSSQQELQKAIDIVIKLDKPYKVYTTHIGYRGSADKNYNFNASIDEGLYYNFFLNYELI